MPFPFSTKNNSLHVGHLISKLAGTFLDQFVKLQVVEVGASRDIGNPALSKWSELDMEVIKDIDTMSQLYLKLSANRFRGLFGSVSLNSSISPIVRCIQNLIKDLK